MCKLALLACCCACCAHQMSSGSAVRGDGDRRAARQMVEGAVSPNHHACSNDLDCSLNGLCAAASGICVCDSGWRGRDCNIIDFAPSERNTAYDVQGNTSSWGGTAVFDGHQWHGFFSELEEHCGINSWLTNSAIVHAVASSALGPYRKVDVALGAWAHEAECRRDPVSGEYLLWHVGTGTPHGRATACKNGSSASAGQEPPRALPNASNPQTMTGAFFHHSRWPEGPWLAYDMGSRLPPGRSTAEECRDNPTAHVANNGSIYVLGLCDSPDADGAPIMKVWRAPAWNGTFEFLGSIVRGSMKGAHPAWSWVDPTIYLDARGHLHVIACMGIEPLWQVTYGGHAYSVDGREWHSQCYGEIAPTCSAYPKNSTVYFVDGGVEQIHMERPKMMLSPSTGAPMMMFFSAGYHGKQSPTGNDDRSFTLARPIRHIPAQPAQPDIYVSASGSDANGDGTKARPFATLTMAQAHARQALQRRPLKRDVVVHVGPGTYYQRSKLRLTEADSGRDGFRMRYVGPGPSAGTDPRSAAVVHGGVNVGHLGWRRVAPGSNIWAVNVSTLAPTPPTTELFSPQRAAPTPPVPNITYAHCGRVEVGLSINGHDLVPNGTLMSGGIDKCCEACAARADCHGWSYCNLPPNVFCWAGHNRRDHIDCYLKTTTNVSSSTFAEDRVSGIPGDGCKPSYYHPVAPPPPVPSPSPAPPPNAGWRFFNLIEAREGAVMARLPESGSGYLKDLGCSNNNTQLTCPEGILPSGLSADDASVFVNVGADWFSQTRAAIAVKGNPPTQVEFADSQSSYTANDKIYLQGDKRLISEPGEWALEHKTGMLFYWPRNESNLHEVVVATTVRVLDIRGSGWVADQRASAIDISGLVLSGSDFSAEYDLSICKIEADVGCVDSACSNCRTNDTPLEYREGLIRIENASDIRISDSAILDAGHSAVWLQGFAQNVSLTGNRIERPGFCGVYAQGIYPGDTTSQSIGEIPGGDITSIAMSDVNKNHIFSGNSFYDFGKRVAHGAGLWFFQAGRSRVSHNQIVEGPRDGIGIYGNRQGSLQAKVYNQTVDFWTGLRVLHTRHIEVDHNRISNTVRDTSDAGALEYWGTGAFNTAHHNCLSDMDPGLLTGDWMNYFFQDDAAHYTNMSSNILFEVKSAGSQEAGMIKSIGSIFSNNVIGDSLLGHTFQLTPYLEPAANMEFTGNIFVNLTSVPSQQGPTPTPPAGQPPPPPSPPHVLDNVINSFTTSTLANSGKLAPWQGAKSLNKLPYGFEHAAELGYGFPPLHLSDPVVRKFDNNTYFGVDHLLGGVDNNTLKHGWDRHAVDADPLLMRSAESLAHPWNRTCSDYVPAPHSPVYQRGFVPISAADIGLPKTFLWNRATLNMLDARAGRKIQAERYNRMHGLWRVGSSWIGGAEGAAQVHFPFASSAWARYDKVFHSCGNNTKCVMQVRFRSASKPDPLSPAGQTRRIGLAVGAPVASHIVARTKVKYNPTWQHLNLTMAGGALGNSEQTLFLMLDGECFVDYFQFLLE